MRIIDLPNNVSEFIEYCSDNFGLKIKINNKNYPKGIYKIINKFFEFVNPEVNKRYATVLFGNVWIPGNWFDKSGRLIKNEMQVIELLIHEMAHEEDRKKMGNLFFSIAYLFPQILGFFSFFAIFSFFIPKFIWFLIFLIFFFPIPSPSRTHLELKAYRINVAIAELFNGKNYALAIAKVIYNKQFNGSAYYWMFPFNKEKITNELVDLNKLSINQKLMINWYKKKFELI
jgi:hypothetical protein